MRSIFRSCWGLFWPWPAQDEGISIDGIMVCAIFHSCYPMMSLRTSSCPAMTCLDVGFLLQQWGVFSSCRNGTPSHLKEGGCSKKLESLGSFFLEHICDFLPFLVIVVLLLRPCQAWRRSSMLGPLWRGDLTEGGFNPATNLDLFFSWAGPHANESSTLVVWFPFCWTSWLCFLAGRLFFSSSFCVTLISSHPPHCMASGEMCEAWGWLGQMGSGPKSILTYQTGQNSYKVQGTNAWKHIQPQSSWIHSKASWCLYDVSCIDALQVDILFWTGIGVSNFGC